MYKQLEFFALAGRFSCSALDAFHLRWEDRGRKSWWKLSAVSVCRIQRIGNKAHWSFLVVFLLISATIVTSINVSVIG